MNAEDIDNNAAHQLENDANQSESTLTQDTPSTKFSEDNSDSSNLQAPNQENIRFAESASQGNGSGKNAPQKEESSGSPYDFGKGGKLPTKEEFCDQVIENAELFCARINHELYNLERKKIHTLVKEVKYPYYNLWRNESNLHLKRLIGLRRRIKEIKKHK